MSVQIKEYKSLTEEEVEKLAHDIHNGFVYVTTETPKERIPLIFVPLRILEGQEMLPFIDQNITIFYEYMSEKKGEHMNGDPIFYSYKRLDDKDFEKVYTRLYELEGTLNDQDQNVPS